MEDRAQHGVETSWLFDLVRRKGEESAGACAILAKALSSSADYALSDRRRSALNIILRTLVEDIAASIRDRVVLAAERLRTASMAIPDDFFQNCDGALMDVLVRNGLYDSPALVEAAAHRLCQDQVGRAQRQRREQDESKPDSLTHILLLETPSATANALDRYEARKSHYVDGFDNPVLPFSALDRCAIDDLVWRVAAALGIMCASERPVGTAQFDGLLDAAAAAVADSLDEPGDSVAAQLATAVLAEQRLGEDALVRIFRLGEAPLAEAWIAARANLPLVLVRRLLYEKGGERFAVLARFIGLSSDGLCSIHKMTRPGGAGLFFPDGSDQGDPLALFAKIDAADAGRMIRYWSLSPDYQSALTALRQD